MMAILNKNIYDLANLKEILRKLIIRMIEDYGVTHFINAMRLGAEQLAGEIILDLKDAYQNLTLEGVIPYESIASKWSEEQRDRYFDIMSKIDIETLLQYHYTSDCNIKLIKYMVLKSQMVLAVGDITKGKIGKAVKYARSIGRIVIHINPETMQIIPDIRFEK